MTMQQFLDLLRARRLWLIVGTIAVVALTLVYSFVAPKRYVAQSSLVVDSGPAEPVTATQGAPQYQLTTEVFLETQGDIIASHRVATDVVDALWLTDDPDARRDYLADTGGAGTLRDWLGDRLLKRNLVVKLSSTSNVITIAAKDKTPTRAAAMANAFAADYIKTTVELKAENARRQAQWLDEQVRQQRNALEHAQDQLSQFQRVTRIADTRDPDRTDVETNRLDALSAQLVAVQAMRSDAESRLSQLRLAIRSGHVNEVPDLVANPTVQSIKAALDTADVNRAELARTLGTAHPQYQQVTAGVATLTESLNRELATIEGSIQQTAQQAAGREGEISRLIEQQKEHMLVTEQNADRQDVLAREVQSARVIYDAALQRQTEATMQGRLDESNIAILSAAVPPAQVASPRPLRNSVLACVLALLFGPALVLLTELRHPRVRSEADLKQLGLELLSEVPRLEGRSERRASKRRAAERAKGAASTSDSRADGRVTA